MADKIVSWGGIDSKGTDGMGVTGSLSISSGSVVMSGPNSMSFNYTADDTSPTFIKMTNGGGGINTGGTIAFPYGSIIGNFGGITLTNSGGSSYYLKLGSSGDLNWTGANLNFQTSGNTSIGSGGISGTSMTFKSGGSFVFNSFSGGFRDIIKFSQAGNLQVGGFTDAARVEIKGSGATSSTTALLVQNANASASLQVLDNGNTGIGTAASATYKLNVSGSVYLTDGFNSDNDTVVVRKYTSGGTLMTIAGYSHYNSTGLSVSNAVGIIATAAGLGVSGNNNVGVGLVASGTQSGLGFALGAVLRRALIAKNTGTTGISMYSAAALQIDGTDGGLLLPTLTTSQRNSLTAITSFSILTSGSGYTNGTYQNQNYISIIGGSGSLGRARVVVSGGSVTSVTTDTFWGNGGYGLGYQVGDIVSGSIAGGSGWTSQVTGVMVPQGLTVYNSDSKTVEVYNSSSWQPLITADYSGSTRLTGSSTISGSLTVSGSLIVSGSDITSGWTAYTPVWTAASVNPVIGNGTIEGYYKVIGKTCFVRGNVAMGSTTTFGSGEWYISMPFTASHADAILMTANLLDNGTAWYNATMNGARAGFNYKSTVQYQAVGGTADSITPTTPFTWANTDRFLWNGSYEIA